MKTTTKTEDQLRIAELEKIVAHQAQELSILAPRHGGDHARDERRRAEFAKDQVEQAIRNATPEERVRMFPTAYATGGGRTFLQTLASYCEGGVVAFARICDEETLALILASTPHPDQLLADMEEDDSLAGTYVRITAPINTATFAEAPKILSEEQGARLRNAGIFVSRIGRDDASSWRGFRNHERPYVEFTIEAWNAMLSVDEQLVALVARGVISMTPLSAEATRAKLAIESNWSVSHG